RPDIMAQLVEAIEGIAEACAFFETPITGGNVSLYNETLADPIFPTPVLGIVGLMKTEQPVTIDFKSAGRSVILLGGLGSCDDVHFGGTEYAKAVLKRLWGLPPALDMDYEKRVQAAARAIVAQGLAESAHDLSDGGLAVALAESSFGPAGIGAALEFESGLRPEFLLFHEAPSRILISTADPEAVLGIARQHSVEAVEAGRTVAGGISICNRGESLLDCGIRSLRGAWEGALEAALRA
ncbi:MAG: AIR synthase-related protein, partial [Bryobacteraceae bacterium]